MMLIRGGVWNLKKRRRVGRGLRLQPSLESFLRQENRCHHGCRALQRDVGASASIIRAKWGGKESHRSFVKTFATPSYHIPLGFVRFR